MRTLRFRFTSQQSTTGKKASLAKYAETLEPRGLVLIIRQWIAEFSIFPLAISSDGIRWLPERRCSSFGRQLGGGGECP